MATATTAAVDATAAPQGKSEVAHALAHGGEPATRPTAVTRLRAELAALGWQRVDSGSRSFSFMVPPDMSRGDLHGIDSEVADFQGQRIDAMYDFGEYSPAPDQWPADALRETITVGEVVGTVGRFRWHDRRFDNNVALHLGLGPRFALYFHVSYRSEDDYAIARKIIDSIMFTPTDSDGHQD